MQTICESASSKGGLRGAIARRWPKPFPETQQRCGSTSRVPSSAREWIKRQSQRPKSERQWPHRFDNGWVASSTLMVSAQVGEETLQPKRKQAMNNKQMHRTDCLRECEQLSRIFRSADQRHLHQSWNQVSIITRRCILPTISRKESYAKGYKGRGKLLRRMARDILQYADLNLSLGLKGHTESVYGRNLGGS